MERNRQLRDRISELLPDIVDQILGYLPIEEAARMAVLSTFWRDMWFSLTELYFDSMFFSRIKRKYSHACSSNIRTQTTQEEKKNNGIWMSAALYVINKVLNQHNGRIRTFFIDFKGLTRNTLRSRSFDLDQWFLIVTQKGVEEIHLSLRVKDEYRLPNCIFSCLTLRRLYLDGVSVESINAHCTLPNVISLFFRNINFVGGHLPVPVDFPMLKCLSFTRCHNLSNLNISAQKLYSLTINNCHFDQLPINSDLRSVRALDLDSYALKDFAKRCTRRGLQPQPLELNVEILIVSECSWSSGDISSSFIHLLQICPKVRELDINLMFAAVFPKLSEFRTVAQRLKMLHRLNLMDFVAVKDFIVFTKGLLACFPALEEVVITRSEICEYDKKFEKFQEELWHFPCASTKAKIFIMDSRFCCMH